jgi:dTMP kinase
VEKGLNRRKESGGEWNRLDAYTLAFHRRVREGYLTLVANEPQRWRIVDAAQSIENVQESLQQTILFELNNLRKI